MRGKLFITAAAFAMAFAGLGSASAQTAAPAGDQPGDASSTASINPGAPITGAINPAGEKDWFRLHVRRGQLYNITLTGLGEGENVLDPVLRVVSASGEELAVNDDDGGSLNSRIQYMPTGNADVFVEARAFNEQSTGGYTLAVAESMLPPDDAGNDRHTDARLTLGTAANGAINFPHDKDWFKIRLHEGQTYRFSLNSAGEGDAALADTLLRLIDKHGQEVARDDDGGDGLNSYLEFTAPENGVYFAEASSFNEEATGGYTLTALAGDVPADATTEAGINPGGDSREGALTPAGDKDWFRLHLNANQTVRIALNSSAEGGIGDPVITVYDSESKQIAQDDDGGEGLNSLLEFTAPKAGDYFIEAKAFSEDAQGKYTLSVTDGEIGATADTADMLTTDGEGRSSVLQTPNDVDWFAVNLVEGRPYRFNLAGEGDTDSLGDPLLTLFDSDGHQVAIDDDGGPGVNSYLTYTSASGGVYYAAVSSFNAAGAGHYHLSVTDTDVPGNTDTDETLSSDGDERSSIIEIPGDKDYFHIELEEGARYEFALAGSGDHPLQNPLLTLSNSADERVASDDNSGAGLNARLRFTAQASDVYYLQASGVGRSTGGYTVSVNRLSAPTVHAPLPPTEEDAPSHTTAPLPPATQSN